MSGSRPSLLKNLWKPYSPSVGSHRDTLLLSRQFLMYHTSNFRPWRGGGWPKPLSCSCCCESSVFRAVVTASESINAKQRRCVFLMSSMSLWSGELLEKQQTNNLKEVSRKEIHMQSTPVRRYLFLFVCWENNKILLLQDCLAEGALKLLKSLCFFCVLKTDTLFWAQEEC